MTNPGHIMPRERKCLRHCWRRDFAAEFPPARRTPDAPALFRLILPACAVVLLGGAAMAQDYPSRPVKIVVPYPAGGSNDIVARIVAQKLSERSGQSLLLAKLQGEVAAILSTPDVKKRFVELGAEPGRVSGEAFAKFLAEETTKWGGIIRASGAVAN